LAPAYFNVVLVFSGGEKALYECRVQLDPTAFKFSETRLYVTQTRLVFELEQPKTVEISEIMEARLDSFLGEQYITVKYKDLSGVNTLSFVCTGFGGIISNISKTLFVYKLIGRLRDGMHPRDMRLIMSGSTLELYAPWVLLAAMVVTPAAGVLAPLDCPTRFAMGLILLISFVGFSLTSVYRLLFGRLRWPVCGVVCTVLAASMLVLWDTCSAVEVVHPARIYGKEVTGNEAVPGSVWHCLGVESDAGRDRLCVTLDDWNGLKIGDKVLVYYVDGPLTTRIVPFKYDDRTPEYVIRHRT
jgi:hypothetical protein